MNDFPIQNPNLPADKQDIDNIHDEEIVELRKYRIKIYSGDIDDEIKYFEFITENVGEALRKVRFCLGGTLNAHDVCGVEESLIKP